jgi:hypothetical protein
MFKRDLNKQEKIIWAVSKQYRRKMNINGGKNMLYKKLGIFVIMLVMCSGLVTAVSVPSRNLESKNRDKTSHAVLMNNPPSCDFGWSPAIVYKNQNVHFMAFSYDPDGPILKYAWNFDYPNEPDTAWGPTADRVFTEARTYIVSLWVAGDQYYNGHPEDQCQCNKPMGVKTHSIIVIDNITNLFFQNQPWINILKEMKR